ncbi:MAG TPA: acyl-CoA thioesterase [Candidatus Thermoplasmatota archaeon]|nr:acyl-CoA thioesterase [Candidatus Thermoplasmatota archaeon]
MKAVPIRATRHESSRQMFPADANPASSVYGGSIMKYIDEVAAAVALRHARTKVVTASIERMDFDEPVLVGDLLVLKAALIFTGRTSMIIGVRVEAENLLSGKIVKTGSCYLTFVALNDRGKAVPVAPVEPADDEERKWFGRGRKLYELRKAILQADRA